MTDQPKSPFSPLDLGIHYVKDKSNVARKGQRKELCIVCRSPATCMPRLYVPCSKLSLRQIKDVSALMAATFCDRHFSLLKASQFLDGEKNRPVRESIEAEFQKRGSHPNFDKAVIGRIPVSDPDFARGQQAVDTARRN